MQIIKVSFLALFLVPMFGCGDENIPEHLVSQAQTQPASNPDDQPIIEYQTIPAKPDPQSKLPAIAPSQEYAVDIPATPEISVTEGPSNPVREVFVIKPRANEQLVKPVIRLRELNGDDPLVISPPPFTLTDYAQTQPSDATPRNIACGDNEFLAGIAVRSGGAIDWIGILCKNINAADEALPQSLTPLEFGGGSGGTLKTIEAPAGFAITGVDVKTCNVDGRNVVGKLRFTYRGVSRWGLHSKEIKGRYIGTNCGEPSPRSWTELDSNWKSLVCKGTNNVLTGFIGRVADHVEDIAGLCGTVTFPDEKKRPVIYSAELRRIDPPVGERPLTGQWDYCLFSPPEAYTGLVYKIDRPDEDTDIIDFRQRCSEIVIQLPYTRKNPIWDNFAQANQGYHNMDCPDGYMLTRIWGGQGAAGINRIFLRCTPVDLEGSEPLVHGDTDLFVSQTPPLNGSVVPFDYECPTDGVITGTTNVREQTGFPVAKHISGIQCHSIEVDTYLCGNGIKESTEACDRGNDNVVTAVCQYGERTCTLCDTTCREKEARGPFCGDGNTDANFGEGCDDGPNNVQMAVCNYGERSCTLCDNNCKVVLGRTSFCGDGMRDSTQEECDDGNMSNTDSCLNTCKRPTCGDGLVQPGAEQCDDGNQSNEDSCLNTCRMATCGDGFVRAGTEQCDDRNLSDNDGCLNSCKLATCGDGIIWTGMEECDRGMENSNLPDAFCRTDCKLAVCGDGITDVGAGEECDDKNLVNSDACPNTCKRARCGDSFVQTGVDECDDGNTSNNDTCLNTCKMAKCGDTFIQTGVEECDDGNAATEICAYGQTSCTICNRTCQNQPGTTSFCGDNLVDLVREQCDDGNAVTEACTYGQTSCTVCDSLCKNQLGAVSFCGDNTTDPINNEECDDGNFLNTDFCLNTCKNATCGDGFIETGVESCDNGTDNSNLPNEPCRTNCMRLSCGDGIIDNLYGEVCDNGANNSDLANKACRTDCTPRRCGDGIVDAGELCDNGINNIDNGPFGTCSTRCLWNI